MHDIPRVPVTVACSRKELAATREMRPQIFPVNDRKRQEGGIMSKKGPVDPHRPTVSVVIATAGRRQCLPKCIASLRRQMYTAVDARAGGRTFERWVL